MDLVGCIVLLLLFFTFVQALRSLLAKSNKTKDKNLPPGPAPLPIIGNLLDLGKKPHQCLAELAKIHGPIMSLKLGRVTTIVVSSADMAKAVLLTHDQFLSNRTIPDAMTAVSHHQYSLPFMPVSTRWRDLRKICNNQLFANKILDASQDIRRKKVQELLLEIHQSSLIGEAVYIGRAAFKTTLNLLSNTVFSLDLLHSAGKAGEFKELVTNIMKEVGTPNLADYFPALKMIDPQGVRRRTAIYFGKLLDLFQRLVDQRLKLREGTGSATNNDMLDALLNISQENTKEMDIERIPRLSLDLFVAGSDTVTSTLEWAMAELLHNPKAMSKAKAELEETIGRGKQVEESDIARLPYLQAIMKETFRLHPAVPFLLPRRAEINLEISGYKIPEGAQVLVNVWAIGKDPTMWENPNSFSPERFLGSDIDVKGRSFELTPFGAGRRICPGLPLGLRMLFLMLGSLINSFEWKLEGGIRAEDMDMEDKFGLTLEMARPLLAVPISQISASLGSK